MSRTLLTGGRVLTGVIFVAASVFKIFSLPSFRVYLHSLVLSIFAVDVKYDSISIMVLSIVIITSELTLGILLVFSLKKLITLISGLFVITVFIVVNIFSFLSVPDLTCNCFGNAFKLPVLEMLAIDFIMLLMLLMNLNKYTSSEFERKDELQEY